LYFILCNIVIYIVILSNTLYADQIAKVKIGLNLSGIVDHATQWVFTNAFLSSRPWTGEMIGVHGYYHDGVDVDNNGWVKSLKTGETAFSLMFVDIEKKYPKGKYLLTYDGEGSLQFKWKVSAHRKGNGSYVLDVLPDDAGIEIRITEINPDNPIRNIRLMMPGYWEQHESNPYHHLFLEKIRPFSIYRFMDWQETNNSTISSWEERAKVTDATFASGKGVPLEYMIRLCNIQNASPWFNIPHLANNEYIRMFAEYVKEHLQSSSEIYIEYSNEVWNNIFEQHRYTANMGRKMGLSDNDFQAYARFYSQRSIEIFMIWKEIFGDSPRLKFILAGQVGNNWLAEEILNWKGAHTIADAYAVAPYFGGKFGSVKNVKKAKEMSLAEFEADLRDDIRDSAEDVRQLYEILRQYGISLYSYEAGQHLVGVSGNENDEVLNNAFDKINREKAMKRLYSLYLELWKRNGGEVMMIFSSIAKQSKWGRWGIAENMYVERAESPKLDAILDFIESE
jgi:hypothetical protein